MNWDESQMAASAFAKGHGGMSLGDQWSLAAMLREGTNSANGSSSSLSHSSKARSLSPGTLKFLRVTLLFLTVLCAVLWIAVWIVK